MESGLLIDQDLNERLEQSLPAFFHVVNKLEEPQTQWEPFLGYVCHDEVEAMNAKATRNPSFAKPESIMSRSSYSPFS